MPGHQHVLISASKKGRFREHRGPMKVALSEAERKQKGIALKRRREQRMKMREERA